MGKVKVLDKEVGFYQYHGEEYICLTDMAKYKDPNRSDYVIQNWLRNRNTIEYLGIWETLYNPDFKPIEFDRFRKDAGLNAFTMSPQKWIDTTNARGIIPKHIMCLS